MGRTKEEHNRDEFSTQTRRHTPVSARLFFCLQFVRVVHGTRLAPAPLWYRFRSQIIFLTENFSDPGSRFLPCLRQTKTSLRLTKTSCACNEDCMLQRYFFSSLCGLWLGQLLFEQRSGMVFGHKSLSIFLRYARNLLSARDPGSPVALRHGSAPQRLAAHATKVACFYFDFSNLSGR